MSPAKSSTAIAMEGPLAERATKASPCARGADLLEDLLRAAREGEALAAHALCAALRPRLVRAAFAVLGDVDEADDIAQEALVRALTRPFVFGLPRSIQAWALKVTTNLARNRGRDQRRRRQILDHADEAALSARGALRAAPGGALDEVLAQERRARAEAALGALPARQREVARLRLFGELSFVEIGVALGIREENARVTFSQARRRLEAALGPGDPS